MVARHRREQGARCIGGNRHRARRLLRALDAVARAEGFSLYGVAQYPNQDFLSGKVVRRHRARIMPIYSALEYVENRGHPRRLAALFRARVQLVSAEMAEEQAFLKRKAEEVARA